MSQKSLYVLFINICAVLFLSFVCCDKSTSDNAYLQSADFENAPNCRDYAGLLGEQAYGISRHFEVFCRELEFDFVVVTLPDLAGRKIQERAVELFEEFDVGKKKIGRGILLVLSCKENAIKFEVGYNLEHVLTDAFCEHLANNSIGDFKNSTDAVTTLNDIILALNSRMNIAKNKYEDNIVRSWEKVGFKGKYSHSSGGAGAVQKLEDMADDPCEMLTDEQRLLFPARETPEQTLDVFLQVLRLLIKDPYLDIYSDATKIGRYPDGWNLYSSVKYMASLERCQPYEITIHGRFAVAKPNPKQASGWPFFLVQGADGKWRLDEARLIQNCFINKEGILCVSTRCKAGYDFINDPYLFAYGGTPEDIKLQQELALEVEDGDLFEQIRKYDTLITNSPDDWKPYWKLAHLYLYCNAITKAYPLLDKALLLKSDDFAMFEEAAFITMDYNFMYHKALSWYQKAHDMGCHTYHTIQKLGFLYGYFKDGKKAEKYLDELTRRFKKSRETPYIKLLYAVAYFYQGNKKQTKKYLLSAKKGLSGGECDYFSRMMGSYATSILKSPGTE